MNEIFSLAGLASQVPFVKTVGDAYLNKYLTVLVPYFSQVYFSKHATVQESLNTRSSKPY